MGPGKAVGAIPTGMEGVGMGRAYLFPGQGSQTIGMGKALAEAMPGAKQVFEEVDDTLGMHLTRLMFEGPEEELMLTENAQPALMAVSVAVSSVLEDSGRKITDDGLFVAGHSLGEYSALVCAGSLALGDAAKLLRIRGTAMQAAVPVGKGAMAALLGAEIGVAREVLAETSRYGVCEIANDNGGGQIVISGELKAVEAAITVSKNKGIKRCMMLPVSAPFHSKLMEPAAKRMVQALDQVAISSPGIPLVSNVTASAETDPNKIRSYLVEQITSMVRWRESMDYMCDNTVDTFIELGSGRVLSGLARRINRDCTVMSIHEPGDIDSYFSKL